MPIVNVTGLTFTKDEVKEQIRKGIQVVLQAQLSHKVKLELSDTKITFVEDFTETNDAPAIAQLISQDMQKMSHSERDEICDAVLKVIELAKKPFNEVYPVAILGMRYRDNPNLA